MMVYAQMKHIHLKIPEELGAILKEKAEEQTRSVSNLVRVFIKRGLSNEN